MVRRLLPYRYCGERLDVWVVRFGNTTTSGYHGINEVVHCTTAEAIGRLSSLWFLDNKPGWARQHAMDTIVHNFTKARNLHKSLPACAGIVLMSMLAQCRSPKHLPEGSSAVHKACFLP